MPKRWRTDDYQPPPEDVKVLPLFAQPDERKAMTRRDGHETSEAAADVIYERLTNLQRSVLAAFAQHGPMTDEMLYNLPEFHEMAESTARKRRTELYQRGYLAKVGEAPNVRGYPMTLWGLTSKAEE